MSGTNEIGARDSGGESGGQGGGGGRGKTVKAGGKYGGAGKMEQRVGG